MLRSLSLFAVALLAFGQPARRVDVYPIPYAALREALALTDAQVQQLTELQRARQTADQAIYQRISAKQKQITEMLNGGNADALSLGRIEIEIAGLRRQMASPTPTRDQALSVLDSSQRAKLADLQNALNLQAAAQQAVGMGLIQPTAQPVMQYGDHGDPGLGY
jgi:hypothetical protein